jgi:hypothetical protein
MSFLGAFRPCGLAVEPPPYGCVVFPRELRVAVDPEVTPRRHLTILDHFADRFERIRLFGRRKFSPSREIQRLSPFPTWWDSSHEDGATRLYQGHRVR